jgi:hypothetical protein
MNGDLAQRAERWYSARRGCRMSRVRAPVKTWNFSPLISMRAGLPWALRRFETVLLYPMSIQASLGHYVASTMCSCTHVHPGLPQVEEPTSFLMLKFFHWLSPARLGLDIW